MTRISVSLIALLWVNSLVAEIGLFRTYHSVSFVAFAYWTVIYAAIGIGLARRARLAYWFGSVLSLLELVPAILLVCEVLPKMFGSNMPHWYSISVWISFGFGVALLISLLSNWPQKQNRIVPASNN